MEYKVDNIVKGALIYSIGDTIATIMLEQFDVYRLLGMIIIGATIYAFEIPNYFNWISKVTEKYKGLKLSSYKTGLAILYFNPLWIARHILFIKIFTLNFNEINIEILQISLLSFVVNIPISIVGNYIIQNKMPLNLRFIASAIFSGLMAIYYAFSTIWFN